MKYFDLGFIVAEALIHHVEMDDKYCGNCKHFNGSGGYVVTCCDVNRPWFCCYSNTVACENYEKVKDKMEKL